MFTQPRYRGNESILGQTSIKRQHREQSSPVKFCHGGTQPLGANIPAPPPLDITAKKVRNRIRIPDLAPPLPHTGESSRGDAHFCWSVGFWMIVFSPSITCCFSWCDSIPAEIKESINTSELQTSYTGACIINTSALRAAAFTWSQLLSKLPWVLALP